MIGGRAELTNVRRGRMSDDAHEGACEECGKPLVFWLDAAAHSPTVYEEASIVLRCSCGASSVYTVTP